MLDHVESFPRGSYKLIPYRLVSTLPNVVYSASVYRYKHTLLGLIEMSLSKIHACNRFKVDAKP